jgi:hypothetical protein
MTGLGDFRFALVALLALGTFACQEQLTQPGRCPELCPGGSAQGEEAILVALPNQDSLFTGYVQRLAGGSLLVGSGIPTATDTSFGIVKFDPRPDSVTFVNALLPYTIDSIEFDLPLVARDSLFKGLQLALYKLPGNLDTGSVTYANASPSFIPGNLIGSIAVPDTQKSGTLKLILRGASVSQLTFQPADGRQLTLGLAAAGPGRTGLRVGTILSAAAPSFTTYAKPVGATAGTASIKVTPIARFNTYVSKNQVTVAPNLLTLGGAPSSRILIRFPWPALLKDSASIVRATLELVPTQPITGLPNDLGFLGVRAVTTDLGAKSPTLSTLTVNSPLALGPTDTVRVEVVHLVQLWQIRSNPVLPPVLFLALSPEAANFTQPIFGSTRSGAPPRLRINYLRTFPFQSP